MKGRVRRVEELKLRLDALVRCYGAARLPHDPLSLVRPYPDPRDREVAGLVASALAFGAVPQILRSVRRVLDVLGASPARAVAEGGDDFGAALRGFRHRWVSGEDVAALLAAAGGMLRGEGSVEAFFAAGGDPARDDLRDLLSSFARRAVALAGGAAAGRRGFRFLFPDPATGGAAKRSCLYLRWMARPDDGVDLGVWTRLPPARLVIPLDTHVHRIARMLGLTRRRSAGFATALEVTAALRLLCPGDPVRYDFALAQLGISRDCPRRCDPCPLAGLCPRRGRRAAGIGERDRFDPSVRRGPGRRGGEQDGPDR